MPRISVVIPYRNRSNLLPRAVRSVLEQTFQDFELILIDDGSTQASDIQFSQNDIPVVTTSIPPSGVSAARNQGVKLSNSPWIAFLDSDDEWLPMKLQRQWEFLQSNEDIQVLQSQEKWIRYGKEILIPKKYQKTDENLWEKSLKSCMVTMSSVLISREIYWKLGGLKEELQTCEDYDLWLRILVHTHIHLLPEYHLLRYSGHGDQLSERFPAMDRFRIYSLFLVREELISDRKSFQKKLDILELVLKEKLQTLKLGQKKRTKDNTLLEILEEKIKRGESTDLSLLTPLLNEANFTRN